MYRASCAWSDRRQPAPSNRHRSGRRRPAKSSLRPQHDALAQRAIEDIGNPRIPLMSDPNLHGQALSSEKWAKLQGARGPSSSSSVPDRGENVLYPSMTARNRFSCSRATKNALSQTIRRAAMDCRRLDAQSRSGAGGGGKEPPAFDDAADNRVADVFARPDVHSPAHEECPPADGASIRAGPAPTPSVSWLR